MSVTTGCLTPDQAQEFCTMIGLEYGGDPQQACERIISKVDKRMSCIRKAELQKLATSLGVSKGGTMREILDRIKAKQGGAKPRAKGVPKKKGTKRKSHPVISDDIETKVVRNSVKKNVVAKTGESCAVYGPRKIVVIKVPDQYINFRPSKKTDPPMWLPQSPQYGYPTCRYCAFYLSTGTSNMSKNFPGMWFPVSRIKTTEKKYSDDMDRGWLSKMYGLQNLPEMWQGLAKLGLPKSDFLIVFFEKFSHWWQVQISAALPSDPRSLWNVHEELIKLKGIVLNWDFFRYEGFNKEKIITAYIVGNCNNTQLESPEEVNQWLEQHDALCQTTD